MKKFLFVFLVLVSGCATHSQQSSNEIQQKMQNAAVAQQQHQSGVQSQSTYFGSGNYNTLPNTLR
jgi:outer membrane biogenesis lipoprotein LolB